MTRGTICHLEFRVLNWIHCALLECSQEAAGGLGKEVGLPEEQPSLPQGELYIFTSRDDVWAQRNQGKYWVQLRTTRNGLGQCFFKVGLLTIVPKFLSLVVSLKKKKICG